jgi:hypothetical protein
MPPPLDDAVQGDADRRDGNLANFGPFTPANSLTANSGSAPVADDLNAQPALVESTARSIGVANHDLVATTDDESATAVPRGLDQALPPSATRSQSQTADVDEENTNRELQVTLGSRSVNQNGFPYVVHEPVESEGVDFEGLQYLGSVDENLLCPICKSPFVMPVTTECDHTFCHRCLFQCYEQAPICPVDRTKLPRSRVRNASRLLRNQLGDLQIACPNGDRCTFKIRREGVAAHLENECELTLIPCPDPACDRLMERGYREIKDVPCFHIPCQCPKCDKDLDQYCTLFHHFDTECEASMRTCICGDDVAPAAEREHGNLCPSLVITCPYGRYGCGHSCPRRMMVSHRDSCAYRVVSSITQLVATQQNQIQDLQYMCVENKKKLMALEDRYARHRRADRSMVVNSGAEGEKYHTPDEAFLAACEHVDHQLREFQLIVSEQEVRSMNVALNHVRPLNDQVTELRNMVGTLGIHVASLLKYRHDEFERSRTGSRVAAAAVAAAAATASDPGRNRAGSSGDSESSTGPRRLSDSLIEIPRL